MKMIEILVDVFQDEENFNKETEVIRDNKTIKLVNKYFLKGDRYSVSKKRAKYLEEKGIAKIIKEEKNSNQESGE